ELTRPQASPPSLAGGVVALGRSPQVARGRVEVQVLRVLARSRLYYRLRDGSIIGSGQPEGVRADDAAARHAAVAVRGVEVASPHTDALSLRRNPVPASLLTHREVSSASGEGEREDVQVGRAGTILRSENVLDPVDDCELNGPSPVYAGEGVDRADRGGTAIEARGQVHLKHGAGDVLAEPYVTTCASGAGRYMHIRCRKVELTSYFASGQLDAVCAAQLVVVVRRNEDRIRVEEHHSLRLTHLIVDVKLRVLPSAGPTHPHPPCGTGAGPHVEPVCEAVVAGCSGAAHPNAGRSSSCRTNTGCALEINSAGHPPASRSDEHIHSEARACASHPRREVAAHQAVVIPIELATTGGSKRRVSQPGPRQRAARKLRLVVGERE